MLLLDPCWHLEGVIIIHPIRQLYTQILTPLRATQLLLLLLLLLVELLLAEQQSPRQVVI
jgi:hypothetical protein